MPMYEVSKGPEGSAWRFQVALGRDQATGKYRTVVEHFHGPSQSGKQPPKVVREAFDEFVQRARAGLAVGKRGATLNDAWDRFLEVAELAPYTRVNYVLQWDKHLRPAIGRTRVADLAPMHLSQLYKTLVDSGALSASSVRKLHAYVRDATSTAVNLGWIVTDPALGVRTPRVSARRHPEVPTPEHIAKLIELAEAENPELAMFYELAVSMGARRGEVVALRRSNLEEQPGGGLMVKITNAAYQVKGQPVGLKDTKAHQERPVHLARSVATMVRAHLARQTMRAHAGMVEMCPDPYLFARDVAGSRPWRPDYATQRFTTLWARVERLTGAPHAKLHDLRHFHITELIDAGVPMPEIRDRVGHSSLQVTNGYAGSRADADAAAAEVFESRRARKAVGG